MAEKDNKTEDPTPKRLRDAKKKGQVAKSADLNSATSLFVFTILLGVIGNYILSRGISFFKRYFVISYSQDINFRTSNIIFTKASIEYILTFLPVAIIAMILGVIINISQVGFIFTTETLKPDIKKLNPIQGFKNIFSKKSMFALVKNILKLILVFYLSYKNLSNSIGSIINSTRLGTENLFPFFINFIKSFSLNIAVIMFMLALVDFVFEKREFKNNLKMTKQEIIDEYKEMEGDPQIKGQRRQRQRELAMGRMLESVKESTVVVANPTHIAIALRYDEKKDRAPIILAKGAGHIAKKIKEKARECKVPIIENKPVARKMYKELEVGDYINEELYQVVAEILIMVYEMEKKNKGKI